MIGAPQALVPDIKGHLEMMGSGFDLNPALVPAMDAAVSAMTGYVDDLLKERRARRPAPGENNLLDDLVAANEQGDRMSDQELYDMVILLFGAGYDTSKNLLTMIVHQMTERPEAWKRLADEPGFAARVLEEGNRFANVTTSYRVAKVDVTYRDVVIPAGTFVAVPLPLAGHDPSKFSRPEAFDPDRTERGGIGFGVGAHICLGQWIARAQIEEGLPIMARRLRNLRADGPVEFDRSRACGGSRPCRSRSIRRRLQHVAGRRRPWLPTRALSTSRRSAGSASRSAASSRTSRAGASRRSRATAITSCRRATCA